ncbi:unnamed protein product [Nippostrongylus brasiliensis]|uniref:Uncharacterized protein n=1 Tax=Nippostrongylus brasiliensis TaxID=27835 RepID=A0A0N4YUR4_NIPBR|nr:unnamed protein product [Nippostrongylus brasiliensis]
MGQNSVVSAFHSSAVSSADDVNVEEHFRKSSEGAKSSWENVGPTTGPTHPRVALVYPSNEHSNLASFGPALSCKSLPDKDGTNNVPKLAVSVNWLLASHQLANADPDGPEKTIELYSSSAGF